MKNLHRPTRFDGFVGQAEIKTTLKTMVSAAKLRQQALDHILFNAHQGQGKTTLATILAHETKRPIRYSQGAMLREKSELLLLLSGLSDQQLVFIDEIHSLNSKLSEILYIAMEDRLIDVVLGYGSEQKIIRLELPPFTLIGATTKIEQIPLPFQNRFGLIAQFKPYSLDDMMEIIRQNAQQLKLTLPSKVMRLVVDYADQNPRIAINILRRLADFIEVEKPTLINPAFVKKVLSSIGLHLGGVNPIQITYLKVLASFPHQTWISLATIAKLVNQSPVYVVSQLEPLLLGHKLIVKSTRGRQISELGRKYLSEPH
ncbi:Holliday junction branch migration DNA helicase RuvB [Mycoplasma sp. ATU-Cv-703]|uniref:Holliday junction branch migration DNA helicase RuvB n=1 Tax=Mycoplasma sp. ATU-Cv-703 TaxID=2498595 RepID=UPI00137515C3